MSDKQKLGVLTDETVETQFADRDDNFKFDAFISYRHVEPDASVAGELHRLIESYNVPKSFYENGKRPVFRVFRDREELSAVELAKSIEEALQSSRKLIVICSKNLPLSPWCIKEVSRFIEIRGPEHVIPVLLEGEPSESFPPQLLKLERKVVNEKGEVVSEPIELLAADIRPEALMGLGKKSFGEIEKNGTQEEKSLLKIPVKKLKHEKYRILASMLDCTYGDLKQRDKERRTKRLMTLAAFSAAVLTIFSFFLFNAYSQANKARLLAVQENSSMLLNRSDIELNRGNGNLAMLIANKVEDQLETSMPNYEVLKNKSESVLFGGIYHDELSPVAVVDTENRFTDIMESVAKPMFAVGLETGKVGVFSSETGGKIKELSGLKGYVKTMDFSKDGEELAVGGLDNKLIIWDTKEFKERFTRNFNSYVLLVKYLDNQNKMIVLTSLGENMEVIILDSKSYKELGKIDLGKGLLKFMDGFDGKYVYGLYEKGNGTESNIIQYNLETFVKERAFPLEPSDKELYENVYLAQAISPDGKTLLSATNNMLYLFNTDTGEIRSKIKLNANLQTSQTNKGELPMGFSIDGKTFYFSDGYNIYWGDTDKGILEYKTFGKKDMRPKRFASTKDDGLVVLYDNGAISYYKGKNLVIDSVKNGIERAEYIKKSKNGDRIYLLAMANQEIAVMNVGGNGTIENVPNRFVMASENREYAILQNNGKSLLWDLKNNKEIAKLPEKVVITPYYKNKTGKAISNDGKQIVLLWSKTAPDGKSRTITMDVMDIITGDIKYSQSFTGDFPDVGFSRDNKMVYVHNPDGKINIIDIEKKTIVKTINGFQEKAEMFITSEDGQYLAINYLNTRNEVYNLQTGEVAWKYQGKILQVDGKNQMVYGIKNNNGFKGQMGNTPEEWSLSVESGKYGAQTYQFINDLNLEKDLLLTMTNGEGGQNLILQKFSDGKLITSFNMNTSMDIIDGVIMPGGDKIITSKSSNVVYHAKTPTAFESNMILSGNKEVDYTTNEMSSIIKVESMDNAKLLRKKQLGSRKIDKDETQSLGTISR